MRFLSIHDQAFEKKALRSRRKVIMVLILLTGNFSLCPNCSTQRLEIRLHKALKAGIGMGAVAFISYPSRVSRAISLSLSLPRRGVYASRWSRNRLAQKYARSIQPGALRGMNRCIRGAGMGSSIIKRPSVVQNTLPCQQSPWQTPPGNATARELACAADKPNRLSASISAVGFEDTFVVTLWNSYNAAPKCLNRTGSLLPWR